MPSGVRDMIGKMNVDIRKHEASQLLNPFSGSYDQVAANASLPDKKDADYGHPTRGSKTEARALEAAHHIQREVELLLMLIDKNGTTDPANDLKFVLFGRLFKLYDTISDKLVGILMRARKLGLVAFQGEMLYQRRDDNVPIYLLYYGDPAQFFRGQVSNGSILIERKPSSPSTEENDPETKKVTTSNSTTVKNNISNPNPKSSSIQTHATNLENSGKGSSGSNKSKIGQHTINKSISQRAGTLFDKMDEYDAKGTLVDNAPKLASKKVTTPSEVPKNLEDNSKHKTFISSDDTSRKNGERRNSILDRAKTLVENMERDAAKGAIPGTAAKVSHPEIKPLKTKAVPDGEDTSLSTIKIIEEFKSHEQRVAASTPISERTAALYDKLEKYSGKGALPGTEAKVNRPKTTSSGNMTIANSLKTPETKILKSTSPPSYIRNTLDERTGALMKHMNRDAAKGAVSPPEKVRIGGRANDMGSVAEKFKSADAPDTGHASFNRNNSKSPESRASRRSPSTTSTSSSSSSTSSSGSLP